MEDLYRRLGVDINVAFYLIFYSLIWVRVLAMASVLPFLFGKPVPRYVTVGASMALAVFVFTQIVPKTPPPIVDDNLLLIVLYLKEALWQRKNIPAVKLLRGKKHLPWKAIGKGSHGMTRTLALPTPT